MHLSLLKTTILETAQTTTQPVFRLEYETHPCSTFIYSQIPEGSRRANEPTVKSQPVRCCNEQKRCILFLQAAYVTYSDLSRKVLPPRQSIDALKRIGVLCQSPNNKNDIFSPSSTSRAASKTSFTPSEKCETNSTLTACHNAHNLDKYYELPGAVYETGSWRRRGKKHSEPTGIEVDAIGCWAVAAARSPFL